MLKLNSFIAKSFSVLFLLTLSLNSFAQSPSPKIKAPKNVIVMIGDGMGFNHIKAADYFQYGEEGKQVYEKFPVKYAVATFSAKTGSYGKEQPWTKGYSPADAWSSFNYLLSGFTESAGAGTALATGKKAYNNSIGMDLDFTTKLVNLTEEAKSYGKAAGVVTSVLFFDATPACFVTHNATRKNYSQIAQDMILESQCDVIMGIGNPLYDGDGKTVKEKSEPFTGGNELWKQLTGEPKTSFQVDGVTRVVKDIDGDNKPDAWTLIQDKEDFIKLMSGDTPKRVFGLPKVSGALQQTRSGDEKANAFVVPLNQTVPTLAQMGLAAINIENKNKNGFFLMIEGGAIDDACHANQKGRMIEEMIDFNNAIESVVNWIETNSSWDETLLIVTADHETGYIWGPVKGKFNDLVNNGKNKMPGMEFNSNNHSNSLVAFFAKGAGSQLFDLFADQSDSVRGRFFNNTTISNVIKTLFRQ